jgi:hypothetical protein
LTLQLLGAVTSKSEGSDGSTGSCWYAVLLGEHRSGLASQLLVGTAAAVMAAVSGLVVRP